MGKAEDEKTIEFLEYMGTTLKLSLSVVAAPLLLIISQLNVLIDIEIQWIKILVTITILCLVWAAAYQFLLLVRVRHLSALKSLGTLNEKSFPARYLAILDPTNRHSEEDLLKLVEKWNIPVGLIMLVGWLVAIFTIFAALWS